MDSSVGSMQARCLDRRQTEIDWADMAQKWIDTKQQYAAMLEHSFVASSRGESRPPVSSLPRVYNSVTDVMSHPYPQPNGRVMPSLYSGHPALLPTPRDQRMVSCVNPVKQSYEPCMSSVPPSNPAIHGPNRCLNPRMPRLSMPPAQAGQFPIGNFGPVHPGPQSVHWKPQTVCQTVQYPSQFNVDCWRAPAAHWLTAVPQFDRQERMPMPRALSNSGLPVQFPMLTAADARAPMPTSTASMYPINEPPSFNYQAWRHATPPSGNVAVPMVTGAAGSPAVGSIARSLEQRKTLPNWIRDGLEKIEHEKRRSADGSTEGSTAIVPTQHNAGESSEDHCKVSGDSCARSEVETQLLLRCIQKELTAILLEVTNSAVETICEKKFKEEKGKAQPKLLAQSTALASILHLGDDEDEQEGSSEAGAFDDRSSDGTKRSSPTFRAPLPPPPSRFKSSGGSSRSKKSSGPSRNVQDCVSSDSKDRSGENHCRSSNWLKHQRFHTNGTRGHEDMCDGCAPKVARRY
uniref:Uncharacterized protein n=1 Tax=Trichuris muris TaxID=70415 RepID=A0A5S6Q7B9_TRIMR